MCGVVVILFLFFRVNTSGDGNVAEGRGLMYPSSVYDSDTYVMSVEEGVSLAPLIPTTK